MRGALEKGEAMARKHTRRRFLETGLKGSLVALGSGSLGSAQAVWADVRRTGEPARQSLSSAQRSTLRAVADELIPAGDDMPAASELNVVAYIETVLADVPDLRENITAALRRLEESSETGFQRPLHELSPEQRIDLLRRFEKEQTTSGQAVWGQGSADPDLFASLRDVVYEAYYTNPEIWPRVGYEFHEARPPGVEMEPFDEGILSVVRRRPKNYREVPDA